MVLGMATTISMLRMHSRVSNSWASRLNNNLELAQTMPLQTILGFNRNKMARIWCSTEQEQIPITIELIYLKILNSLAIWATRTQSTSSRLSLWPYLVINSKELVHRGLRYRAQASNRDSFSCNRFRTSSSISPSRMPMAISLHSSRWVNRRSSKIMGDFKTLKRRSSNNSSTSSRTR